MSAQAWDPLFKRLLGWPVYFTIQPVTDLWVFCKRTTWSGAARPETAPRRRGLPVDPPAVLPVEVPLMARQEGPRLALQAEDPRSALQAADLL